MTSSKISDSTPGTIATARSSRLANYCAAGAGATVLAGAISTADASITFINFNNQVFTDTTFGNGASTYFTSGTAGNFDFNNDGIIDFRLRQRASALGSSSSLQNLAGFAANTGATATINVVGALNGGLGYPSRLAAGTLIGPAATFVALTNGATGYLASLSGYPASKWVSTTGPASGFVGVNFTVGAQTFYGWVGLSIAGKDAATPYAITLSGIAYENVAGVGIVAGQTTGGAAVPEPSSLALVALGGVGLAAYRRRAKAKAAAQAVAVGTV